MEIWNVKLLGTPSATCNAKEAHLRSRLAWATFAALLLQPQEGWITRNELITRFWNETDHSRVSLRMALSSLRANFGADCIETKKESVRIRRERFHTDLNAIEKTFAQAQQTKEASQCLRLLTKLERSIEGEFLEGCHDPEDSPVRWISGKRAEWNVRCADILLALAQALEASANPYAAFEAVCKGAKYAPHQEKLWQEIWRIGRIVGRTADAQTLHSALSFPEAVLRLTTHKEEGRAPTLRENRAFQDLLWAQVRSLSPSQQRDFLTLSLYKNPFLPNLAQQVSGVRPSLLEQATSLRLLERTGANYTMQETIRQEVWAHLNESTKRRLNRKLARLCTQWSQQQASQPPTEAPLFASPTEAQPHLAQVFEWYLASSPTLESVQYIKELEDYGVEFNRPLALQHCEAAATDTQLPQEARVVAALLGGNLALKLGELRRARHLMLLEYEAILASQTLIGKAGFHFRLAVACHHAEQPEEALKFIRLAQEQAREAQHLLTESHAMRFEGEVLRSQGEYSRSSEVLEQALQISKAHDPHTLQLAECLYQCGVTLRLMGNKREATARQEEALRLRLEAGEDSGTADCLREVARMKAQEGETLWARVLLSHAFILYEKASNGGGKAAAQIEMGDLCQQEGRVAEAKTYWQEALHYWEALGHQRWQEGVRKRLKSVSISGT